MSVTQNFPDGQGARPKARYLDRWFRGMTSMARVKWIAGLASLFVAPSASAQVVQLPTFRQFSVSTTVVVPDRGAAYLGGVDRAAYGSTSSGVPGLSRLPGAGRLFQNRARGYDVSSSRAYATATIIDREEMDRAVLAEAAARRGGAGSPGAASVADAATVSKAAFLARHIDRSARPTAKPLPIRTPGPLRRNAE